MLQTTRTLREEFEKTLSGLDLAGEEQVAVVVKKLVEFLYGDTEKEKKASKAAAENAQAQRLLRVGQEDAIIGSDALPIIPNQIKSGIAAMARKLLLKRNVDATIDDVCAVQQYCDEVEKETKLRANQCGTAWKVMHDAIFHDYSAVLASLLPTSTMTDKLRRDISFNMLLRVIAQMDNILKDITMRFGTGRDLNRHVVEFRKATAYTFKSINRLSSAQILVEKDAQGAYSQQMETLASLTSAQLTRIEKVIKQLQKPPRRDRSTKWMSTLEVSVATPSEALTALDDLEEILYVIGDFAIQFAMDLGRFLTGRPEDPRGRASWAQGRVPKASMNFGHLFAGDTLDEQSANHNQSEDFKGKAAKPSLNALKQRSEVNAVVSQRSGALSDRLRHVSKKTWDPQSMSSVR
ncbi:hypothetical protein NP233_g892 [Leucocoprinus birnbaumii]|uniref:Uncharacterized protein n=1 Tax=Leucocoprinus birnbaumii TaxID=56174 RepID=A0AAD5W105_9AGAR|nr:hypothetical protein NP233_g892 [Leucocoprinus birnbaumii]